MDKTRFEPGPWKATSFTLHTGEEVMRIVPTDAYGIINRGPGPICEVFSQKVGIPDEACIANGYLIATAPELYNALELLLSARCGGVIEKKAIKLAQAALAKARGEQK